jgi:hypothetical protein
MLGTFVYSDIGPHVTVGHMLGHEFSLSIRVSYTREQSSMTKSNSSEFFILFFYHDSMDSIFRSSIEI